MGMNKKAANREGTPAGAILGILRAFQARTRSIIGNAELLADALGATWIEATVKAIGAHHNGMIEKLSEMKFGRSDQEQALINECIIAIMPSTQDEKAHNSRAAPDITQNSQEKRKTAPDEQKEVEAD